MTKHAGIHIVKNDIVVRQRKMRKGRQGNTAFQHTAHHTGNLRLLAYCMDLLGFLYTARFGELDIYIITGAGSNDPFGIVVIENALGVRITDFRDDF